MGTCCESEMATGVSNYIIYYKLLYVILVRFKK